MFPNNSWFILFFFRNPKRDILTDELSLVSPADGVVMDVERVFEDHRTWGGEAATKAYVQGKPSCPPP